MTTIRKPYWLLLTLTLPQGVLCLIFLRLHGVIGTLLSTAETAVWLAFGLSLGLLWLGFTAYAVAAMIRRGPIHPLSGLGLLGLYIPWLYLVFVNFERLIPWRVPRWMFLGIEPVVLLLTLVVPALAYALFLLVAAYTPERGRYKPLRDVIVAVAVPAAWYLLANLGLGFMRYGSAVAALAAHVLPILLVLSTAGFLFVTARLLYAFLRERKGWREKAAIPFLLVLPVLGLEINRRTGGFLGDFTHPVFYVLAVLTGLLLVLPPPNERRLRFGLYALKCLVFPFTVYFFLVFLPYLPLAIPLIIVFGMGFLILAPLVMGIKHVLALRDDYRDLCPACGKPLLLSVFLLGCALLPGAWYLAVRQDGIQVQRALAHLYRTGYRADISAHVSASGLSRALKNMAANRARGRGIGFSGGERTPYLTSLYNMIVLDNLTLSRDRIQALERVFLGRTGEEIEKAAAGRRRVSAVTIQETRFTTRYDGRAGEYRSMIDLTLQNTGTSDREEYATAFTLPAGCYVVDYYLVVEGRRKKGMLADRRAATWVYRQVVDERKDPGVMYYGPDGRIILKVFPFAAGEIRRTGFTVVHGTPVELIIGGRRIRLGQEDAFGPKTRTTPGAVFIPAAVKGGLPRVTRRPAYHFVVDCSAAAAGKTAGYVERVASFIRARGLRPDEATVTAANADLVTVRPEGGWRETMARVRCGGGYDLDRAVKTFLYEHYRAGMGVYPLIVAVTDTPAHWRLYEDYAAWQPAFPESDAYYRLGEEGELHRLSLLKMGEEDRDFIVTDPPEVEVLAWPAVGRRRAFLPNDGLDGIVLTDEAFTGTKTGTAGSAWETGLALEARSTGLMMNPADYRARELSIIRDSLRSGVMTRSTSYIVLENEAQEAALRAKQRQILATGKVADLDEGGGDSASEPEMVEPSLVVVMVLGVLIMMRGKMRRLLVR